jgi:hypothetical protein
MATQAKGSRTKIIYDTEVTFTGTPSSLDAHVLPFVSETLKLSRNLIDSKTLRGSRNPRQPAMGNREVAGDITVEFDPYMGKMLYNLMGTFSTKGASPYSHTFTVSDLPGGMTIEKGFLNLDTPQYFQYRGCKVNSAKWSFKPEGYIETVFSMMGAAMTITAATLQANASDWSSSTTATYGSGFTGFEATIKEGGTALGIVTQLDLNVENNLDGSVYVINGTGQRYSMPEGLVKVSGTATALFDSMTQFNKALNNQSTSLQITLTHGTGAGSAGNEMVDFWIDELVFEPNSPVISGPGGIMVELPFTGFYQSGASGSSFKIILWNLQTQGMLM